MRLGIPRVRLHGLLRVPERLVDAAGGQQQLAADDARRRQRRLLLDHLAYRAERLGRLALGVLDAGDLRPGQRPVARFLAQPSSTVVASAGRPIAT
jgi:hypothetical protein